MNKRKSDSLPLKMLESEMRALRRDLRVTGRAYLARLEIELAESAAVIDGYARSNKVSREHLHALRDLTIMLRKRKLKAEKGRRKDLRKIDSMIGELHAATHPNSLRA